MVGDRGGEGEVEVGEGGVELGEGGVDDPRVGLGEEDGQSVSLAGQLVALGAGDSLDEPFAAWTIPMVAALRYRRSGDEGRSQSRCRRTGNALIGSVLGPDWLGSYSGVPQAEPLSGRAGAAAGLSMRTSVPVSRKTGSVNRRGDGGSLPGIGRTAHRLCPGLLRRAGPHRAARRPRPHRAARRARGTGHRYTHEPGHARTDLDVAPSEVQCVHGVDEHDLLARSAPCWSPANARTVAPPRLRTRRSSRSRMPPWTMSSSGAYAQRTSALSRATRGRTH